MDICLTRRMGFAGGMERPKARSRVYAISTLHYASRTLRDQPQLDALTKPGDRIGPRCLLLAAPQFFALMERLEALPALRNMRPYTATQMALALGLARTLFHNEPIPVRQFIQVRRLIVVAA